MLTHLAPSMDSRLDRAELASQLRNEAPAIMASLLFCDFGELRREVEAVEAAGVAAMHLDVMDGHFVPNLSYRPADRRGGAAGHRFAARRAPDDRRPGASTSSSSARPAPTCMTIHVEAVADPRPVLERDPLAGRGGRPGDQSADAALGDRSQLCRIATWCW